MYQYSGGYDFIFAVGKCCTTLYLIVTSPLLICIAKCTKVFCEKFKRGILTDRTTSHCECYNVLGNEQNVCGKTTIFLNLLYLLTGLQLLLSAKGIDSRVRASSIMPPVLAWQNLWLCIARELKTWITDKMWMLYTYIVQEKDLRNDY